MPTRHRLKIQLAEVKPAVWRRLELPSAMKLPQVSRVLLEAMGWTDTHLHAFRVGRVEYGVPDPDFPSDMRNERSVTLETLAPRAGDAFWFDYDFGDGWRHKVTVEAVAPAAADAAPHCLAGARACPPEDCGGPYGYRDVLAAYADPRHEDHERIAAWLPDGFDPGAFDLEETNEMLRRRFPPKRRAKAKAAGAGTREAYRVDATYVSLHGVTRGVEIAAAATLQQLHLALLAAGGYTERYTRVDREFRFTIGNDVRSYPDAKARIGELLAGVETLSYECAPARLRALVFVAGSFAVSRTRGIPTVYDEGAKTNRRLTAIARKVTSFTYLNSEPRTESAAFRHGLHSAVIAGPMVMPSAYLSWLVAEPSESIEALNKALGELTDEHNVIAERLLNDREAYCADFARRFGGRDAMLDWTHGFAFGMSLNGDAWMEALRADEQLSHCFEPIAAFIGLKSDPQRRDWLDDEGLRHTLAQSLPRSVVLLWERWREMFAKAQPALRSL